MSTIPQPPLLVFAGDLEDLAKGWEREAADMRRTAMRHTGDAASLFIGEARALERCAGALRAKLE